MNLLLDFLESLRRLRRLENLRRTVRPSRRRWRGNLTPCRFANRPQEECLRILRFRGRNPLPERNRFRPGIRTENQDKLQERRGTCYTDC